MEREVQFARATKANEITEKRFHCRFFGTDPDSSPTFPVFLVSTEVLVHPAFENRGKGNAKIWRNEGDTKAQNTEREIILVNFNKTRD